MLEWLLTKRGAMQTTTKLQVIAGRPTNAAPKPSIAMFKGEPHKGLRQGDVSAAAPRRRASDFDIDKLVFWLCVAIFACAVAMI
jgi:hypothetical protein